MGRAFSDLKVKIVFGPTGGRNTITIYRLAEKDLFVAAIPSPLHELIALPTSQGDLATSKSPRLCEMSEVPGGKIGIQDSNKGTTIVGNF